MTEPPHDAQDAVVGAELASQVADALEQGVIFANGHRDYCGMALAACNGVFVYDWVYDGYPPTAEDAVEVSPERRVFTTRDAFVDWLAVQSDDSLSGMQLESPFFRNNQRIRVEGLRRLVEWHRQHPGPYPAGARCSVSRLSYD